MPRWFVVLPCLAACDDHLFPPGGGTTDPGAEGWCAVESLFASTCEGCHSAAGHLGGLDLETDPYAAVVGVVSAAYGVVLVEPGQPDASLLQSKLEGTQSSSEGQAMPPGGSVDPARIAAVRQWIADGAPSTCDGPTPPPGGYHPDGWAEPGVHGLATKLGEQDCRTCHGADLDGGTAAVACSTCHPADWTTTCTYCHGDPVADIAAPPEDIDDNANPATITFPPHRLHLSSPLHATWACTECHKEPTSALDAGHLFDDATAGIAELVFTSGLSATATYTGGTCSNVYCHGNGRAANGVVTTLDDVVCGDCHSSGAPATRGQLSGEHEKHLDEGLACAECHPGVTPAGVIDDGTQHVDGDPDVELPVGMTYSGTCTGTCHGEAHNGQSWTGGNG